jgi:hypothetical protein
MLAYSQSIGYEEAVLKKIFDHLKPILEITRKFRADLEACEASWRDKKGLGKLFLTYVRARIRREE